MTKQKIMRCVSLLAVLCILFSPMLTSASSETSFLNSSVYINVRNCGAKGDAVTDDTAAICSAIAAAQNYGKTVFFPSGLYKITKSILVPAGVSLEGITSVTTGPWQNLYDGESKGVKYNGKSSSSFYDVCQNPGSWILATNGCGDVNSGATFQLQGNNAVRKLGFINLFCPPTYDADTIPTPPVIGANVNQLAATDGIVIEDISLSNPYYGIAIYQDSLDNNASSSLSGNNSGPISISNVMGAAMYRGISIIGVNGAVSINNVQFNYANYGTSYVKQHWNYCTDIEIAASENVSINNVLSFGAHTGLQTSSAFCGSPVNLTANNLNLEGEKPLVLNASGTQTISNSYLLLCNFADSSIQKDWAAVTINQDSSSGTAPVYTLTNLVFQDAIGDISVPDIQVDVTVQGGATVSLTNATMWNWNPGTNEPIIRYAHNSGGASTFTVTNLALCSSVEGLLAAVDGSSYSSGELTFVYGRFPSSVMGSVNKSSGAPIKFISCTKFSGGSNTQLSN